MDIEVFIERYHFLSDMTSAYKVFNRTVNEDDRTFDEALIEIIKTYDLHYEDHQHIYEKLMRNLSSLLNRKYNPMENNMYCRFLHQRLYHFQQKYDISEFALSLFYTMSHANIVKKGGRDTCSYFSYRTEYENPLNIIKLENMHYNIDVIQNTLKSENDSINSCQKYVCECYKIYKEMYQNYCQHDSEVDKKRRSTCDKLREFRASYMSFLFGKKGIEDKIPSLYDAESVPFSRCSTEEKEPQPREADVSTPVSANEPGQRPGEGIAQSSTLGDEQSDNPIPFNTTSVVSAMAGIPPFLALIYKVIMIYT
ncbi:hypothetical protein PVBG_05950 [Plasmodium vivax Brazil I]|uniref:Uncharacterized protein n=1 Tax=Plasmodium vivax (strain Brazil I) TaxID=1033975 RepID=A0A0J9VBC8_PLAV1|nr:hypothetical protein PVBG_05950 [Plasmodium vivax Brazil I]